MANLIPTWVDGRLSPVDKLHVHRQGLRHKAVSVFLLDCDRTLIQRRALSNYHTPGLWANTCCTHPEWGEPPMFCATRRLSEELGITGIALTPRGQVEYRADVGGGMVEHELVDVFVGHAPPDLRIMPNPDEVMDHRWITLPDLRGEIAETPECYTPWLEIYLSEHNDQIFDGSG